MYYGVHYMRGVAALLVLYTHVEHKMARLHGWGASGFGGIGVDIFFIISGFVISASYYEKKKSSLEFSKDRFARVIPIYWVLTTFALLVFFIKPELVNSSGGTTSIFSSYTLIPTNTKLLVQNGWTLSYEMYFYAIFAVSILIHKIYKEIDPVVISAVMLCVFPGIGFFIGNNWWLIFNTIVIEFVFGMALYKLHKIININKIFSLLLIPASLAAYIYLGEYHNVLPRFVYSGVPALILMIAIIYLENYIRAIRFNFLSRPLKMLGDTSYSLYLVHPFSVAATAIIAKKLQLGEINSFILMVGVSIVSGWMCWKYLEMPVTNLARLLIKNKFNSISSVEPNN